MTSIKAFLVVVVCAVLAACTGSDGKDGTDGTDGMIGPQGPAGPLSDPPVLSSLSPTWGSANTQVTITGANFSATAADDHVYFDGYPATVLTATATELVVTPGAASDLGTTPMVVSVEVAQQVSNGLFFALVPSGTAGRTGVPMATTPTGVAAVGADLYIAAGAGQGGGGPDAGLYRMDGSTGEVTRLVAADPIDVSDGMGGRFTLMDGPVAAASDGTDVYYTTLLGAVRRYQVSTGEVSEVVAPAQGGGAFPARTGLAFDSAGNLYVVDRNLDSGGGGILAMTPSQSFFTILDPAFAGSGADPGIFGIASDGTDLFISNEYWGEVWRVANPTSVTPSIGLTGDGAAAPQGIAVVGSEVVVSDSDGTLLSAATSAGGGALATWGDSNGYMYEASGMATNDDGDLLMAQPGSSVVRSIASGGDQSTIVAAGLRPSFGAASDGGTVYMTTFGPALFGGNPFAGQPDSAVVEVTAAGATRVLAVGDLFIGVVVSGSDEVTVSDCGGQRIFRLTPSTGAQLDRLDSTDGILCPTGLALDGSGTLFYLNAVLGSPTPTKLGKLTAADVHTANFATGLSPGGVFLGLGGGKAIVSGIAGNGTFPIEAVSATSGGTPTELVPGAAAGNAVLGGNADGRVFVLRAGQGSILELDPASGDLLPFGNALAPGSVLGPGGGSFAFSMTFAADGTMLIPDWGQGALIAVAP